MAALPTLSHSHSLESGELGRIIRTWEWGPLWICWAVARHRASAGAKGGPELKLKQMLSLSDPCNPHSNCYLGSQPREALDRPRVRHVPGRSPRVVADREPTRRSRREHSSFSKSTWQVMANNGGASPGNFWRGS